MKHEFSELPKLIKKETPVSDETNMQELLKLLRSMNAKINDIHVHLGAQKEEPKKELIRHRLDKPILEIMSDGKIWAQVAIAEELEKAGLGRRGNSTLSAKLNDMARDGILEKLASATYRIKKEQTND